MRTVPRWIPVATLLAVVLAACDASDPGMPGGTLDLQWRDTSGVQRFRAPALARWCGSTRTLELTAIHEDSGVGLAVFPAGGLVAESIAVRPVAVGDTLAADSLQYEALQRDTLRPQARLAVRWGSRLLMLNYAASGGWIRFTRVTPAALDGRFGGTLASRNHTAALQVTGELRGIPLVRADSGCDAAFGDPAR